jgi:hypothetical protein
MPARELSRTDLTTDYRRYAQERADRRAAMIPVRAARRVRLGDLLVLEFEDTRTLTYQVQEMLFVEGVTDEAGVQHEIEAYSRYLPSSHSLTATLFIEGDDVRTVKDQLLAMTGIQHRVRLEIGPDDGADRPAVVPGVEIVGVDEDGPSTVTQAVHFLRFTFDDVQRDAFRDPAVPVTLVVEHPEYAAAVDVSGDVRLRLLADLAA